MLVEYLFVVTKNAFAVANIGTNFKDNSSNSCASFTAEKDETTSGHNLSVQYFKATGNRTNSPL